MDLLETVLRAADAEKYIKDFRQCSIDPSTLKILTEDDLKAVGVEEETVRKSLLKYTENLQIPSEKKVDLVFDNEYIQTVLDQMSLQLNRHYASLSCVYLRNDVVVCDIQLTPVVKTLQTSVLALEKSLDAFENQIIPAKITKRRWNKNYLFPTIIVTAVLMFMCRKYALCYNKQSM